MKRLAPKAFESLPALAAPAGYICVIRDIDRDRYRIEATRLPRELVDAVLAERERSFGIELVSLLQTEDLPASEAALFEQHYARLSSEWLELDEQQLETLRRSMLQIDAFASLYLTRELETPDAQSASLGSFGSSGARWQRHRPRSPIPTAAYGLQALRRNRRAAEARRAAEERRRFERYYGLSTEDRIKEYIGEFLLNHIIKITILGFVLFILLLAYAIFSNSY